MAIRIKAIKPIRAVTNIVRIVKLISKDCRIIPIMIQPTIDNIIIFLFIFI